MAERQVTIDGESRPLSQVFFVIATQNPIESHGAYPLPEAQLDRFSMKLEIGYPDRAAQIAILNQSESLRHEQDSIEELLSLSQLLELQRSIEKIRVSAPIQEYLVDLCDATRKHESITLGISLAAC